MILAGYFVLRSPGASVAGNEITADRAIFTAVNAATLTGFQSSIPLEQYQPLAIATILGLMFGGILFTFILGSLAVRRIARLPWSAWQIVRGSIFYTASACALGTIFLAPGRGGGCDFSGGEQLCQLRAVHGAFAGGAGLANCNL